jgi:hypothetical protein
VASGVIGVPGVRPATARIFAALGAAADVAFCHELTITLFLWWPSIHIGSRISLC